MPGYVALSIQFTPTEVGRTFGWIEAEFQRMDRMWHGLEGVEAAYRGGVIQLLRDMIAAHLAKSGFGGRVYKYHGETRVSSLGPGSPIYKGYVTNPYISAETQRLEYRPQQEITPYVKPGSPLYHLFLRAIGAGHVPAYDWLQKAIDDPNFEHTMRELAYLTAKIPLDKASQMSTGKV